MAKRKILFIGGSLNQTTMAYQISRFFPDDDVYFTPYYDDGIAGALAKKHILDWTVLGGKFKEQTLNFLHSKEAQIDYGGKKHNYDLVYTASDLLVPKNVRNKRLILVQEGMTDPENFMFPLVKYLKLPTVLAGTAATGMSALYDRFCVASLGYKELFTRKGAPEEKIVVTGIPNFDNCAQHLNNNFPHKHFVLVATSDMRETYKYENRKAFVRKAVDIANGRQLIFKLHPNEKVERATREIAEVAPGALVYSAGSIDQMIANCDELITKFSSVVYVGLALNKKVHSYFPLDELRWLLPLQNGGKSAERIAAVGHELLERDLEELNKEKTSRFSWKTTHKLQSA